jgi:hypothetical protein
MPGEFFPFDDPRRIGTGTDGTGNPVGSTSMGFLSSGKTPTLDYPGKAFSLACTSDFYLIPYLKYIDPDFITDFIGPVIRS